MTAIQSVCAPSVDPTPRTVISPAWAAIVKQLGIAHVRIAIASDAKNLIPLDLYRRAVGVYHDAGIEVSAVLPLSFNRPWLEGNPDRAVTFFPNIQLGHLGNDRQNMWIRDTCRKAQIVASALAPMGVTDWCPYVEPNLLGTIPQQANVPPRTNDKGPALAPAVWGSYCYEVAGYLKRGGASHVELGALSWIAGSGNDSKNPYCSQYLMQALAYLHQTGVRQLPFGSVSVNAEGNWSQLAAGAMKAAIDACFVRVGYPPLPTTVGEWGVRNDALTVEHATQTYQALSAIARSMSLFQLHLRTPNNVHDYGCIDYEVSGTHALVPGSTHALWWTVLQALTAPAPAV